MESRWDSLVSALRITEKFDTLCEMSGETFNRDAYTIELLQFLADGAHFDGDQIGPAHTLEQISVAEDLIKKGFMRGKILRDGETPTSIGSPEIQNERATHALRTVLLERL